MFHLRLKHEKRFDEAAEYMDKARKMDLADRQLNTLSVKAQLRKGDIDTVIYGNRLGRHTTPLVNHYQHVVFAPTSFNVVGPRPDDAVRERE